MDREKDIDILQLTIYKVIRILMQMGNQSNCHMTWNGYLPKNLHKTLKILKFKTDTFANNIN